MRVPREVAAGGTLAVGLQDVRLPAKLQVRRAGKPWRTLRVKRKARVTRLRAPRQPQGMRFRARGADGKLTAVRRVRVRYLRLSAVGDVNLGDGPGAVMAVEGPQYPWTSVGPRLRDADIAFANLECAVSRRGVAEPKTFTFRGAPERLKATAEQGGIDIVTSPTTTPATSATSRSPTRCATPAGSGSRPSAPAATSPRPTSRGS